jgi:hypothetical protein
VERGLDRAGAAVLELGRHHEQQHQELLVMDAKHLLGSQTPDAVYRSRPAEQPVGSAPVTWRSVDGGLVSIGTTAAASPSTTSHHGTRSGWPLRDR